MSQPPDRTASHPRQTPPTGRRFTESFKRDAVRLITHEQYSFHAASAAVGVSDTSLHKWHKKYADPTSPCIEDATTDSLQAEVNRLRKQLKKAEMERDILKKATAYFASQNP